MLAIQILSTTNTFKDNLLILSKKNFTVVKEKINEDTIAMITK